MFVAREQVTVDKGLLVMCRRCGCAGTVGRTRRTEKAEPKMSDQP